MNSVTPDAWKPHGIDDLEPAAWQALRHEGSACVTAGPGAGKTEFLAQRAGYLLQAGLCAQPQRILAISFKRSAATNLGHRVRSRIPHHAERFVSMTFDSFTKSILDQFGGLLPQPWKMNAPYEVDLGELTEDNKLIEKFLESIAPDAPPLLAADLRKIHRKSFRVNAVGSYDLPLQFPAPRTSTEYAVQQWWRHNYLDREPPRVEFVMINRLAELIVRSSPALRQALHVTYPIVFVDEFQDTTYAQYSFLRSVFGTRTVVTAVGDRKQRIMGWAGALEDAFEEFEADFTAEPFQLKANFRSTEPLVALQHRFAQLLDDSAEIAVAQAVSDIDDHPAQVWSFPQASREAQTVAAFIAADAAESGREYGQYALLARQTVANFEPLFAAALSEHGIALRNDDAPCGRLRLQELLKDPLAQLLIGVLRLCALNRAKGGLPQTWMEVSSAMARLRYGNDAADHQVARLDDALAQQIHVLRSWLDDTECRPAAVPSLCERLTLALEDLTAGRLANLGGIADESEVTIEAFQIRLTEVAERSQSWWDAVEAYESVNAVPLLTIHRSKGLEYHTVFFLALDDDQWWPHPREPHISTSTFFVGLSRAAQRVIFTQCDHRGGSMKIADLYDVLDRADVPTHRFD